MYTRSRVSELPDWLSGLNPQQLKAVTHGDGPLLIIAGAGAGLPIWADAG